MRILPKKHFTWREPKPFLALLDGHERSTRRWWHQPAAVVAVCALTLLSWFLAQFNPPEHPPSFVSALLMAIALGVFLAYFIPWLETKLPSQISVFDRCIVRSRCANQQIRFADIKSFSWRSAPEFSTLILNHRRGRQIFVGVPRDISTDAVTAFLRQHNLPNVPNA